MDNLQTSKKISYDSVSITTEQMEVIKKILGHAYESLTLRKEEKSVSLGSMVWETSEYSDNLTISHQEHTDLCRVLRIIC
jgi:hypothetical protein